MTETVVIENEDFHDEGNDEATTPADSTNESTDFSGYFISTWKRVDIIVFLVLLLATTTTCVGIFLASDSTAIESATTDDNNVDVEHFDSFTDNNDVYKTSSSVESSMDDGRREVVLSNLQPLFLSSSETFPSSNLQQEALDWIIDVDTWAASSSVENKDSSVIWHERYIAAILYFATDGKSWEDIQFWLSAHNTCDWKGIRCDRNGHIESIDLFNESLAGEIPSELGMLNKLTTLILKKNQISGTLPSQLGIMSQIQAIDFSYNNLTGMIPSEVGNLIELESLELSHNNLSGTIPLEVENLARAGTHIFLGRNNVQHCDPLILICP